MANPYVVTIPRLRRRRSAQRALVVFLFLIIWLLYRLTHPPRYTNLPLEFSAATPRIKKFSSWFADQHLERKYFHEPGPGRGLSHYDSRFFDHQLEEHEREYTLTNLIKAYLDFFESHGMETWIAHGTLLGWWWNGQILPWDWDADTQVSTSTLMYMGDHFNGTVVRYTPDDKGKEETRHYLLDVNHWARRRDRGNGDNRIDARFIDIQNGLYIDITGISEVNPNREPGVLSCKNFHKYRTSEIYPLRQTIFEGTRAFVPYRYEQILTAEYDYGLISTSYKEHDWNQYNATWVPQGNPSS